MQYWLTCLARFGLLLAASASNAAASAASSSAAAPKPADGAFASAQTTTGAPANAQFDDSLLFTEDDEDLIGIPAASVLGLQRSVTLTRGATLGSLNAATTV